MGQAVTYQVEDYLTVIPEMRELYPEHWEEIALDKDVIKLEPKYDAYETMAKAGMLHVVTMRVDGELVGYHMSIVSPHLHYASSITAFTDIFFVRKIHRVGMRGYFLLKFMIRSLWERGVEKIYMGTKMHKDLSPILKRLRFKPVDMVHALVRPSDFVCRPMV